MYIAPKPAIRIPPMETGMFLESSSVSMKDATPQRHIGRRSPKPSQYSLLIAVLFHQQYPEHLRDISLCKVRTHFTFRDPGRFPSCQILQIQHISYGSVSNPSKRAQTLPLSTKISAALGCSVIRYKSEPILNALWTAVLSSRKDRLPPSSE